MGLNPLVTSSESSKRPSARHVQMSRPARPLQLLPYFVADLKRRGAVTDAITRAAMVADLTRRLRPVCENWPDAVFTEMVERLADITARYDIAGPTYDRRTTERLMDDLKAALVQSESARKDESNTDERQSTIT